MKMTCFWGDCSLSLTPHIPGNYFLHWGVYSKVLACLMNVTALDEMNTGNHWLTCFMHGGQLGGALLPLTPIYLFPEGPLLQQLQSSSTDSIPLHDWGWLVWSLWAIVLTQGELSRSRQWSSIQLHGPDSVMLWRVMALVSFVSMGGCCVFVCGATASSSVW